MPTFLRTLVIAFACSTASALAQTTHLVGPGGLPQIRAALAIAAPGDVVLVQPGTYAQFHATVGVTIRAAIPGTVIVTLDVSVLPPSCTGLCILAEAPTRLDPPSGQTVHCEGIAFAAGQAVGWVFHTVFVRSGAATFTNCSLRCNFSSALTVDQARVHLQDCTLESLGTGNGWPSLSATAATISAVRCSFTASQTTASLPGPAVRLRSATLQGSQLQLRGGSLIFGGVGGAALDLDATSAAWISDSTLTGGANTCPVLNTGGAGRIDRSVLLPSSSSCTSLPNALVLGIDSTTPPQTGAPFVVDFRTTPNQLIAAGAGSALCNESLPGLADQPVGLESASAWFAGVVTADASGFASISWLLPNGPFAGMPLYVLGVGLAPTQLELSPPVGGVVH
jgi:hypothetical protein